MRVDLTREGVGVRASMDASGTERRVKRHSSLRKTDLGTHRLRAICSRVGMLRWPQARIRVTNWLIRVPA